MKNLMDRITFDNEILCGKPIIRGLRMSVEMILELLSKGSTDKEILKDYQIKSIPPGISGKIKKKMKTEVWPFNLR